MKLDLQENMYVRTKDGIIDKVIIDYNGHCASPNCECKHISCAKNYYDEDKIAKAGYNIIDILEVGDIIEFEVTDEDNYSHILGVNFLRIEVEEQLIDIKDIIFNESAKTMNILTKEQFNQNAYRIGDE